MTLSRTARVASLALLLASAPALAQVVCPGGTTAWTGAGGNALWNNPANWSAGVPGTGANVCFNTASPAPTLNVPATVGTMFIVAGTNLTLTGQSLRNLTINGGISADGTFSFNGVPQVIPSASQNWIVNSTPNTFNSPISVPSLTAPTTTITVTGGGDLTLNNNAARGFQGFNWGGGVLTLAANGLGSGTPITLSGGGSALLVGAPTSSALSLSNPVTASVSTLIGVDGLAGVRHTLGRLTVPTGVLAQELIGGVNTVQLQIDGLTLGPGATFLKNDFGGVYVNNTVSDTASSVLDLEIGYTAPSGSQLDDGLHFTASATVNSIISSPAPGNSAMLGVDGTVTLTYSGTVNLNAGANLVLIPRTGGVLRFGPASVTGSTADIQLRGDATGLAEFTNAAVTSQGVSVFNGLTFQTDANPAPPRVTFSTNAGATWRTRNVPQNLSGSLTLSASGTVDNGAGADLTISGTLAGGGQLTKSGSGSLIIASGANTHTGGIVVNAGTLVVNGTLSGESGVSINNGGALSGGGGLTSAAGPITVASGGSYSPGAGGAGTLTTNDLSLNDTTNLNFTVGTSTTSGTVNGALILDGIVNITTGTGFGQGTYTIFTATSTITNNGLRNGTLPGNPTSFTYGYVVSGNTVQLRVGPPATAVELVGFEAVTSGVVTQLTWEAGTEIRNLGYRVYRDQGGRRVQITPGLIAGSALRGGFDPVAGRNYAFADATGGSGARYWLEAIDMKGQSQWFGPVQARTGVISGKQFQTATLLANVGSEALLVERGPIGKPVDPPGYGRSWTDRDLASQWQVAASSAVKLLVRQDGVYRVSADTLLAAGFRAGTPLSSVQLWAGGRQVAFRSISASGATLQPGDALEFFGQAADTPYTDTRVYWVTAGLGAPTFIDVAPAAQASSSATGFLETLEVRDRTLHVAGFINPAADGFFGKPIIGTHAMNRTFSTPAIDLTSSEPAVLEVSFQGLTDGAHAVDVKVNGTTVGTVQSVFQDVGRASFPLPAGSLVAGDNTVSLVGRTGTEIALELSQRLTYPRQFAFTGPLRFTAPGGSFVQLRGSDAPGAHVLDITSVVRPSALVGKADGASASLTVPGTGTRILYAYRDQDLLTPTVVANTPSSWHAAPGADLVIIGPRALLPSLQPLADQRTREGLQVALVDVEDVYDEFSAGMKDATAIRAFLFHAARSWSTAPRFVLLAGAATYDPRGWLGKPELDQVPTIRIPTRFSETGSDDALVSTLDRPTIAIGRLPVSTPADMDAVVAKILDRKLPGTDSSLLFVRDQDREVKFSEASAEVRAALSGWKSQEIVRGDSPTTRSAILAALKAGPFAVDYQGHGAEDLWAGRILTSEDADTLASSGSPTLLVAATCLNGYFIDIGREALGTALLRVPNGGAWAVWASSASTVPTEHPTLSKVLLTSALDQGLTLGEATLAAKSAVQDADVRATFHLLGDPSARATAARGAGLSALSAPRSGASSSCGTPGGPIAAAAPIVLMVLALVARRRRTGVPLN